METFRIAVGIVYCSKGQTARSTTEIQNTHHDVN